MKYGAFLQSFEILNILELTHENIFIGLLFVGCCLGAVLLLILFVVLALELFVVDLNEVAYDVVNCILEGHWRLVLHQAQLSQDSINFVLARV